MFLLLRAQRADSRSRRADGQISPPWQGPLRAAVAVAAVIAVCFSAITAYASHGMLSREDWLVIGILVYVGWGMLIDAAVHGFAELRVF